jgi:hypothetical protein
MYQCEYNFILYTILLNKRQATGAFMLHFFSSVVQLLNQFYKAFCKIGIVIAQN